MTHSVTTHIGLAKSLWHALIHLRLAFSLVLTPLFIWGVYLAQPVVLPWPQIALAYAIIHIPLYGGMNAFNSYYDRDEGPIGALQHPPPISTSVLVVALLCKTIAMLAGIMLDWRFAVLVGGGIVLSVAYSHPRWRWKARPLRAAICIFVMQGCLGVLWGWTAATWHSDLLPAFTAHWPIWSWQTLGLLSAASWTLGFYPLTGVYQIGDDSRRAVRTLAVALGVTGCFVFAAIFTLLGGLGVWIVLWLQRAYVVMAFSALYMLAALLYTWRWYGSFNARSSLENQRRLMTLAYANGLVFSVLFFVLVLVSN